VLRAYDKTNGKVLAELTLPARPSATPMTYMVDGKQYVVIATADQRFVSFALP
jgi:quinoprotein glucose dehydrogenase